MKKTNRLNYLRRIDINWWEVGQVGSNLMWNFKDKVIVWKHAKSLNDALDADETTAKEKRVTFKTLIEEKVWKWHKYNSIAIPWSLTSSASSEIETVIANLYEEVN